MNPQPASRAELIEKFAAATSGGSRWNALRFQALLRMVRAAAPVFVQVFPVLPWRKTVYILGYDDAVSALSGDAVFATPFKAAMARLDPDGEVSLLGFNQTEDAAYRKNLCQAMQAMPLEMLPGMASDAARLTETKLQGRSQADLLAELLIPITLEVTQKYFGAAFSDSVAFYHWAISISNFCFGGPSPAAEKKRAALAAGKLIDMEITPQIEAAMNLRGQGKFAGTVLGRLAANPQMNEKQIRATFIGLLVGILPNIPIAGYNILQVLMARREAMEMARAAAAAGDDDRLQNCLYEALRFRPILPASFRVCVAKGGTALGPDGWRRRQIAEGANIAVFSLAAMFDGGRINEPTRFDPDRPRADNLAFGHGKHWCLGVPIALTMLTHVFAPLLRRGPIAPLKGAARTAYFIDYFPENFTIAFGRRVP
jgi:cytochrome P450